MLRQVAKGDKGGGISPFRSVVVPPPAATADVLISSGLVSVGRCDVDEGAGEVGTTLACEMPDRIVGAGKHAFVSLSFALRILLL